MRGSGSEERADMADMVKIPLFWAWGSVESDGIDRADQVR